MTWIADSKRRRGYYDKTSTDKPSLLLLQALKFVHTTHTALDIGCGAGVEAKELAKRGFSTTAIDVNHDVETYFNDFDRQQIKLVIMPIEECIFGSYDFIFAKNSLVFLSPKTFDTVLRRTKDALSNQGIFAARLWGMNDSQNKTGRNYRYTFVTKEYLKEIFKGYDFLRYQESEEDGVNAYGVMKHWHFIDVIVRKRS